MVATAWPCCATKAILEIGHVPGRHPADAEWFGIGGREPTGELSQILDDGPAGVGGEVLVAQVSLDQGSLPRPDRDGAEKHYQPEFLRLCFRELDTIWTLLAPNWADKGYYFPTLSLVFWRRRCRNNGPQDLSIG